MSLKCIEKEAEKYLKFSALKWIHQNNYGDIFTAIKEDVKKCLQLQEDDEDFTDAYKFTEIESIITSRAFESIQHHLMSVIQLRFKEEDKYFFTKCKTLNRTCITADQCGAKEKYAIKLTASVVELASLDSKTTPVDKLECLSCAYDLIYAELKSAIITIIAKYSDEDQEIPIINNVDVEPILMIVLIRSQQRFFESNMAYMKKYLQVFGNNSNHNEFIFQSFETAAQRVKNLTSKHLPPSSKGVTKNLDLVEFIDITNGSERCNTREESLLLREERDDIVKMIISSTNQNFLFSM